MRFRVKAIYAASLLFLRYLFLILRFPVSRRVARNFDRGANNNQDSAFKYMMTLVFKPSSIRYAFAGTFSE